MTALLPGKSGIEVAEAGSNVNGGLGPNGYSPRLRQQACGG
jgi:hypothetical protein